MINIFLNGTENKMFQTQKEINFSCMDWATVAFSILPGLQACLVLGSEKMW